MSGIFIFSILLLSAGLLFVRKKDMSFMTFVLILPMIGLTSYLSAQVFCGASFEVITGLYLLGSPIILKIDVLSAFFILVINFTMLMGLLYARGYLRSYHESKSSIELGFHYFNYLWLYISMMFGCMLHETLPFLIAWELISVTSFFLIIFESEKPETIRTGISFLIQMHIGFLFIMAGFLLAYLRTGTVVSFDSLSDYFSVYRPFPLFLLFFTGFGIKAGFIPLHSWLPHAHPAAPSHISGIMSGVIIKMGIYGILRILLSMHRDLLPTAVFMLSISAISGLLGVMYAIVQHDIKRLLAYHSIENIGIIGIGIGSGLLGIATDNPWLATLGFTGGLLHILNHSLFKSLLFFSAGSVYMQTHIRDINRLGGLLKKMPFTGLLFIVGSLAICGLPPFNGFISEFLIYRGLFSSLNTHAVVYTFLSLLAIVALVFIGGLALFCFTKVSSMVFLGSPRSIRNESIKEVPCAHLFPQVLIALFIVLIGIYPHPFVRMILKVSALFTGESGDGTRILTPLSHIGMASGLFFFITLALLSVRFFQQKRVVVQQGPTWGCGYSQADPARHQYTATSFAQDYSNLVSPLVPVSKQYQRIDKDEIFPEERTFSTHGSDIFEENLIVKPVKKLLQYMEQAAIFQSGKLQHYILYAFAFIAAIGLLSLCGVM